LDSHGNIVHALPLEDFLICRKGASVAMHVSVIATGSIKTVIRPQFADREIALPLQPRHPTS
jgi:hypothetical protein